MALFDVFKKKPVELATELVNGVHVLKGYDPNKAFAGRAVSHFAEAEVWMHGGPLTNKNTWYLLNQDQINKPASDIVKQMIDQEKVHSVLLTSCNIQQSVIKTPRGAEVTYGLGYGLHTDRVREGLSPVRSWGEGIVVSEGDTARVFTKGALQAEMERRGLDTSSLTTFRQKGLRGESLGETTAIGMFTDAGGQKRITLNAAAHTTEDVMKFSLPLSEAPSIAAKFKGEQAVFEHGGRSFSTLQEATESLSQSIRSKKGTVNMAAGFLERVGLAPRPVSVAVAGEEIAAEGLAQSTGRAFGGKSFMGILLGGVMSLGAAFTMKGWQTVNQHVKETRVDVDSTPNPVDPNKYNAPMNGPIESFTTKRMEQSSPGGSTNIHITDADLDGDSLDRAFASHLKSGFAHG